MGPAETTRTAPPRWLNAGAHAAFVPIGVVTVLLGPMLPTLSSRWELNYSQAGSLFTAQFLAATFGTMVSGMLVSRCGSRFTIGAGLFAIAVGVGLLPFTSRYPGIACIACYGWGMGLAIPAVNLFVAAANPERRSAALSLLNFSWSVGAVACPFLVAAAARANEVRIFLVAVAGFVLFVLLGIAVLPSSFREPPPPRSWQAHTGDRNPAVRIPWNQPSLFLLASLFFLYVGAETGFGGWIVTYAETLGGPSLISPVMAPSFFYTALLLGRWAAPLILKKMDELKAARAGLALAAIGMTGLILSPTMSLLAGSVSIVGFGLAAVYPITISRLSHEFGPAAARAGSVMFTMANFGGASLPWVMGYASHRFNQLRAGLVVPLAATILMYVLYRQRPDGLRGGAASQDQLL